MDLQEQCKLLAGLIHFCDGYEVVPVQCKQGHWLEIKEISTGGGEWFSNTCTIQLYIQMY